MTQKFEVLTDTLIDLLDRCPDKVALREVLEKSLAHSYAIGVRDGVDMTTNIVDETIDTFQAMI